ncbi:PTS ascorbate transporter subunit IIC [Gracilibacillus caseinilyticus]|uniref:PTS ascorbate transporter subunit IIC n=1 Tax=Gracilibacillus caseinilyticus TaxID=2932256 RepID=A0ABY4ETL5_9BACI|nr:PTS ascorbate transporter subunit IIC [Gracilibacillus caseinilyticus]UOQ47217.1 PTS ascorbate transporter subunit IIC [Gracilibacillus caseinilyticus]
MNLSGVWDWNFYWESFGFFLKTVAPFLMITVAVITVGLLLFVVIRAVKNSRE